MHLGLEGKVALVTGGSKGIGAAIATRLAREGSRVGICGRDPVALDDAARRIEEATGGTVLAVPADVASTDDIERLVDTVRGQLGEIDVTVINPGHPPTSFEHDFGYADADWVTGFEQLVLSVVRLCRATVPSMAERRWGRVVLVTTLLAREPSPDHVLSGALRACSHSYLKSLATEWAPRGVTMNVVMPGAIDTPRARETAARAVQQGLERPAEKLGIPVGRMGRADEVADAVAFLCSDQAAYITGAGLAVDGGVLRGI